TATCPQHSASSGPDVTQDFLNQFLRQDTKLNTFQVEYDFTPRVTGYIGYRYERREITDNDSDLQIQTFFPTLPNRGACAGQPLVNGVCTITVPDSGSDFVPIDGHSALLGFSARPMDKLRVSFVMLTMCSPGLRPGICKSIAYAVLTSRKAGSTWAEPCRSGKTATTRLISAICNTIAVMPSTPSSRRRKPNGDWISLTTTTISSRRQTSAS